MVGLWEHCSWLAGGRLLAVSSHSTGQRQEANSSVSSFYFILFIWLCQILFVACSLTRAWTPASGVQSLSHWTTREAPSLLPRALIPPRRLHFHDLMTSRRPGHHHSGHQSFNMWILRGHKYPQHLPKASEIRVSHLTEIRVFCLQIPQLNWIQVQISCHQLYCLVISIS